MGRGRHGVQKDGGSSPCVARQYSGTPGKIGNCQIAVSIHAAADQASCPLDWRLFVPESWDDASADTNEQAAQVAARRAKRRFGYPSDRTELIGETPGMIGSGPVEAGRMPSCAGRCGPDLFRLGVHDDVAISDGGMADAEFQESLRHPPRAPTPRRRQNRILPLLPTTNTHPTKYYLGLPRRTAHEYCS